MDDLNGRVAPRIRAAFTTDVLKKPPFWIPRDAGVEASPAAEDDVDKPVSHRIIIHKISRILGVPILYPSFLMAEFLVGHSVL